jgi:hypothetical protein
MKTLTSIILLIVLNTNFSNGQSNYEGAMEEALNRMSQAATVEDLQLVANQFERIANVEEEDWLPVYHSAYARVIMAAMEQDLQKKDPYLDLAQQNLDHVEKMEHDATERMALQGFLYMIRMSIDPARGMELGMECGMILNQAYMSNNENPRALVMLGQFNHGSAQYMGTDTSEACAMFETALQLFDQSQDEPDQFLPSWGKELALTMQGQCRN